MTTVVNMGDAVEVPADGERTVLELGRGWRWVRLETAEALDAEGEAMGHGIGSGGLDSLAKATAPAGVYSLRDDTGCPRVTVEVCGRNIQRVRAQEYSSGCASSLGVLIRSLGVGLYGSDPGLFGLACIGGDFMSVDEALAKLAVGGRIDGDVDFRSCTSLTSLPDDFKVSGYLDLGGCTALASLPDRLEVGGALGLTNCPSLTSLPEGLKVGGRLYLDGGTTLTGLPEDLEVGGPIIGADHLVTSSAGPGPRL